MRRITFEPTFLAWQEKARAALAQDYLPNSIQWKERSSAQASLDIFDPEQPLPEPTHAFKVPKRFIEMAKLVALHSNPEKWSLLYRVLWRLTHGEARLLENPVDTDFIKLTHLEKEVTKDAYRMTAFVRFREVSVEGESWFVAWYEPEHDSVACNADFFIDRFRNMRWSILTPKACMHWDGTELTFSEGVDKTFAPEKDAVEPLWISYYSSIFNPARLKVRAMQAQLLKRNWKNLPEASVIEPLIRTAARRTGRMIETSEFSRVYDADFPGATVPGSGDWATLRDAAANCRGCPLWKHASCTVFGEGPLNATIVFVGEQPGDQEDRTGKPFVGPAGQLLDRALGMAGIDRSTLYLTNTVKHFKFEPRGKRRIHKTPSAREIAACRPWLEAELSLLQPRLIVALGGTATHALFGSPLKVLQQRGQIMESSFGVKTLVTVHPSSLLRLPESTDFPSEFNKFVDDLRRIQVAVAG